LASLDGPRLFRYMEDPADELAKTLGHGPVLRPTVPIRLSYLGNATPTLVALVDSGSERTLAAPSMARVLNVDLTNAPTGVIGIGGAPRQVSFSMVHLELFDRHFSSEAAVVAEWDANVGFLRSWEPAWAMVLGQNGLFNEFTVTMHRSAHVLVLEDWNAFDMRFGVRTEQMSNNQPRFQP
jgi:hypothetical protein